jgi:hypothetical protein
MSLLTMSCKTLLLADVEAGRMSIVTPWPCRAWRCRSVLSYARRYRGSRCVIPCPGVVGDVLRGPARSTPSAASRDRAAEGVTLPDLAAPGVALAAWSAMPPLRPVTGPPLRCPRVQALSPLRYAADHSLMLARRLAAQTAPAASLRPRQSQAPPLCRCREVGVREGQRVSTGNGRRRRTAPSAVPS